MKDTDLLIGLALVGAVAVVAATTSMDWASLSTATQHKTFSRGPAAPVVVGACLSIMTCIALLIRRFGALPWAFAAVATATGFGCIYLALTRIAQANAEGASSGIGGRVTRYEPGAIVGAAGGILLAMCSLIHLALVVSQNRRQP